MQLPSQSVAPRGVPRSMGLTNNGTRHRCNGMDPRGDSAGHAHDPRARVLLRRDGPAEEPDLDDRALVHRVCARLDPVGRGKYSLSFGSDIGGFIGGLNFFGLAGIGMDAGSGTYPPILFVMWQLVFAAVTLAILTSAMAERVKLSSFIVIGLLFTTLVYDPLAHWVWGGGWAMTLGALDFAGGTVVHISSGFGALAIALVIGKRVGYGKHNFEPIKHHDDAARRRPALVRLVRVQLGQCISGGRPRVERSWSRTPRPRLARSPGSPRAGFTASPRRSGSSRAGSRGWSRSHRPRAMSACRRAS